MAVLATTVALLSVIHASEARAAWSAVDALRPAHGASPGTEGSPGPSAAQGQPRINPIHPRWSGRDVDTGSGRALPELVQMRTEHGASFLLPDGRIRAVTSTAPEHYRDAAGTWQRIDRSLKRRADGSGWGVNGASYDATIHEDGSYRFYPDRYDRTKWVDISVPMPQDSRVSVDAPGGAVTLATDGYRLEYRALNGKVKGSIYVDAATGPMSWRSPMRTSPGLRITRDLQVLDADGTELARVEAPFAEDADLKHRDAEWHVDDAGALVFSIDPKGLSFPIVIDPTISTTSANDGHLTSTSYAYPGYANCTSMNTTGTSMRIGNASNTAYYNGFFHLPVVSIPRGATITDSTLSLIRTGVAAAGVSHLSHYYSDQADDSAPFSTCATVSARSWNWWGFNHVQGPLTLASANGGTTSTKSTGAVASVVDRWGWASGNSITISWEGYPRSQDGSVFCDGCYADYATAEHASYAAPVFSITYVSDVTAPTPPSAVRDGFTSGVDSGWIRSTTYANGNWEGDGADRESSGSLVKPIRGYQQCLSASSTGADCASTAPEPWYPTATSPDTTLTQGLYPATLTQGTRYYYCVRTVDYAGNTSTTRCSDGAVVDTVPPGLPSVVRDGTSTLSDLDWTTSTTTLSGNWPAATDTAPGTVAGYDVCVSATNRDNLTSCSAIPNGLVNTTSVSHTFSTLSIANGSTYYVCVNTDDSAGNNASTWRCSDGITVDTTPPGLPSVVRDGTSTTVDAQFTNSLTTLSGNWPAGTDTAPGVVYAYDICISATDRDNLATCTPIPNGSIATTAQARTFSTLSLTSGSTYYYCVNTDDAARNNATTWRCSDGITVDTTAPGLPSVVRDGTSTTADLQLTNSTTTLSANWNAAADTAPGTVGSYDVCISATNVNNGASCTAIANGSTSTTSLSRTISTLSLNGGSTYFFCVRTTDSAGNDATTWRCSDGITVDTTPPALPSVVRDGTSTTTDLEWTKSLTTLSGNWPAATDTAPGAVAGYDVCVSVTNQDNLASCTSIPNGFVTTASLSRTFSTLSLTDGSTYYVCVNTNDTAGNSASTWRCSDGITADATAPGLPSVVRDGTSTTVDAQFTNSLTTLSGNWPAATDTAPGVVYAYDICISATDRDNLATCTAIPNGSITTVAQARTFSTLSLTSGSTYYYCVNTDDAARNNATSWRCSDGITVDTSAPNPNPSTGSATAISSTRIDWTIDTAVDEVGGSGLHASTYSFTGGSTWQPGSTLSETVLSPNTLYSKTIRARDAATNETSTGTLSRYTLAGAPTAPTAVAGWNTASGYHVVLGWTAPTGGASSYRVRWASDAYASAQGSPTGTSFTRTTLSAGTTYTFQICAVNAEGAEAGACSATVSATTPPAPPTGITATNVTVTATEFSWTNAAAATSTELRMFTDSTCATLGPPMDASVTSPFTKSGLSTDRAYWYQLRSSSIASGTFGAPSSCTALPANGRTAIGVVLSASSVNLGVLNLGDTATGSTTITASTYGSTGYTVSVSAGLLTSGADTMPGTTSGTVGSPAGSLAGPWTGTGFGFTVSNATNLEAGWSSGTRWARFDPTPQVIHATGAAFTANTPSSTTTTVGYRLVVPPGQAAGSYSTTVTYTVVGAP